ncbi:MAG TPA: hypothetical protein H9814_00595 [Candidatus Bacteroides merdigallinarum]|uniref:Fimbrial subunit protein C-terminal domain-containing protein n=1 Tax=Candidatus Bacteroides merdigallinarum TaxID=2838473 RepID=A0A9D2E773_9BACE|nr:hypothetical protein [Candidatus Bacteroides merdigallinarum]
MKKNYLLLAAFASALTFAACSNDELGEINQNPPIATEVVEGATFEIAISNQGVGTKATRPMGSSAADNNVNTIALKAYKWDGTTWNDVTSSGATQEENKVAFKYVSGAATNAENTIISNGILTYNEDMEESVPGDQQHINKKAKVEVVGLETNTTYQFVAYGYNGTSNAYPYGTLTGAGEGFATGVFKAAMNLDFNDATSGEANKYKMEEIFAAYANAKTVTSEKTDAEGNPEIVFTVTPTLELTRQVAGMLAYFQHIPTYLPEQNNADGQLYKVKKLQVIANHTSSDFYFPAVLLEDEDFNGVPSTQDDEDVLMTFDFSNIAKNYNADDLSSNSEWEFYNISESSESGYASPFAEGYSTPQYTDGNSFKMVDGAIFGARYLLPYDKHYGEGTTLKLRFLGESDQVLQERDVTTANIPNGGTMYAYDIRCNNFYSIGQKLATDTTDPDPDDPDDDDEPIDLRSNDINVRINDAWAVLHNMGIE